MLVLTRRLQQQLVISTDGNDAHDIVVQVLGVDRQVVKLGIQAPDDVRILRAELLEETAEDNRAALLPNDCSALSLPVWPSADQSNKTHSHTNNTNEGTEEAS